MNQMKKTALSAVVFFLFNVCILQAAAVKITGMITGCDGKIPTSAAIHLTDFSGYNMEPIQTVQADAQGNFSLTADQPGFFRLLITSPNHNALSIPLHAECAKSEIKLEIHLAPLHYLPAFKDVKIVGDWNDFNVRKADKMNLQPSGVYTYTAQSTGKTLAYQIAGIVREPGHTVNGTQSDSYQYDGQGDYKSVINTSPGDVTITFDPEKLLKATSADLPQVMFLSKDQSCARFWKLEQSVKKSMDEFMYPDHSGLANNPGRASGQPNYDWTPTVEMLKKKLASGNDPLIRQLSGVYLLELSNYHANIGNDTIKEIFRLIPPESEVLSRLPYYPMIVSSVSDDSEVIPLLQNLADKNPDRMIQAFSLLALGQKCSMLGKNDIVKTCYEKLTKDYKDIPQIQHFIKDLNPDRAILVGKEVPDFEVTLLDGKTTVSRKSLKGKYYIIDFWATWCGPCRQEMPGLHAAYQKYNPKGLVILSLSLDRSKDTVIKFQSGKWKMPWFNAFIDNAFQNPIVRKFEISGIPKPILVGPDSKILATDTMLRGQNLEKTLARFIKE